jgi:oxalate decarboxylase/phosphoglucose isomerase-like protein (cupin superfamily)
MAPADGSTGLARRQVTVAPGSTFEGIAGSGGELWYVISGRGRPAVARPAPGPRAADPPRLAELHLPPGRPHCLENTGPDELVVLGVFHPGGSPAAKAPRR